MLHALLFTVSAACPAAQNRHRPQKRRQKRALPPQAAAPCGQPFCVTVSLRQSIRQVTAPATPGCGPPSGHGPMPATPQTATPSDSACRPSGRGLTAPAPQPVPLAAHAPAHTPDIRQCLAACALPPVPAHNRASPIRPVAALHTGASQAHPEQPPCLLQSFPRVDSSALLPHPCLTMMPPAQAARPR